MDRRRFVITGLNRLVVRVVRALDARATEIVILADRSSDEEVASLLPAESIRRSDGPWVDRLADADLAHSECLLVLGEDDLDNLHITAAASDVAPWVPVVLRAFDPELGERLEAGRNVRRAYSTSALAAPAFVAAAFGEGVLETLRLGDTEVPLCHLKVDPGSPLVGLSPGELKVRHDCAAVARAGPDGRWEPARGDSGGISEGDELVVGGLLLDVLRVALRNGPGPARARTPPAKPPRRERASTSSLVPVAAVGLVVLLVVSSIVFATALDVGADEGLYRAVTNAFGGGGLEEQASWIKVFAIVVILLGGVFVGVLLAHVAAIATANRLAEQAGRRARKRQGHVVVAGLGRIGFRVARLLDEVGVASVVLERHATSAFREAAAVRAPVLSGDIRLAENLDRAGVARASTLIAVTDDDLANIAACVQARGLNPGIRTIARIFDDDLAARLATFGIDAAISVSTAAASAFVGAATDERAARFVRLGDLELVAHRHTTAQPVSREAFDDWRAHGLRILALQRPGGPPASPATFGGGIPPGTTIIVVGPADIVRHCLAS